MNIQNSLATPSLIIPAKVFALEKHQHIFWEMVSGRRLPQTQHLQEVADLVWAAGRDDVEIAAAWLHDSIEDTNTMLSDIYRMFGRQVGDIVDGLTDPVDFKDLPTSERKRRQSLRVKEKSDSVRVIKIADQTSNVRSLTLDPSKGWEQGSLSDYIRGAKLIADQCKGISPILDKLFDLEYERASIYYIL